MSYTNLPFIRESLERALASERGIRLSLSSKRAAEGFQRRAHQLRREDRKENAVIYPEGHALHGGSMYDQLVVRVEGQEVWIEKYEASVLKVEEL
jgi:hypothetical protein